MVNNALAGGDNGVARAHRIEPPRRARSVAFADGAISGRAWIATGLMNKFPPAVRL
jgi:hypothetical protein